MEARYSSKFTVLMSLGIAWSIYTIVTQPPSLSAVLIMVVLCYFVTDLVSGLLHIVLDNPRSLDIKLIAPLAQGFQSHHEDPASIYQMSLYQHLYVMHLPLTLFFFAVLPLNSSIVFVGFLSMVVLLHLMQMSHRWAHVSDADRGAFVTLLQRVGFLVSYDEHQRHHVDPYSRNFCIMNGLCNRMLNSATATFGLRSHAWIAVFLAACLIPIQAGLLLAYAGL